jgi:transcriptional regulator with XRE-family HTH domain
MSLTTTQAQKLGEVITNARIAKGLTQAALTEELGVAAGWLAGLEQGRFLDPSSARLARISERLDIEPQRIERLTKGRVGRSLPGMRVYFRAKYDLSPAEIDRLERYVERLQKERP